MTCDPPIIRNPIIVPDITVLCRTEHGVTKTQHDNCYTVHYTWMNRIFGAFERVEIAHVNSRLYREWLKDYPMPDGIPPHIEFGGVVVPDPVGDPNFKNKWTAYAREEFGWH